MIPVNAETQFMLMRTQVAILYKSRQWFRSVMTLSLPLPPKSQSSINRGNDSGWLYNSTCIAECCVAILYKSRQWFRCELNYGAIYFKVAILYKSRQWFRCNEKKTKVLADVESQSSINRGNDSGNGNALSPQELELSQSSINRGNDSGEL